MSILRGSRRKPFLILVNEENAQSFIEKLTSRRRAKKEKPPNPNEAKLREEIEQKGLKAGRNENIDLIRQALSGKTDK